MQTINLLCYKLNTAYTKKILRIIFIKIYINFDGVFGNLNYLKRE